MISSFCFLSDAPHLNQLDLRKGSPKEEIKEAFYSLPRNKACRPDGYSAESFTGYWDIIGAEVCEAVTEFFSSGQLLKQWNSTTLVLIPKTPTACRTSEFRPIACLNPVYKVIAKLLASRLRDILSHVISPIAISLISCHGGFHSINSTQDLTMATSRTIPTRRSSTFCT